MKLTKERVEEFRREYHIPPFSHSGPREPWADAENEVLNAICDAALETFPPEDEAITPGTARYTTAQRIVELDAQAAQEGDWETAFTKMAQRANTLARILDAHDRSGPQDERP